MISLNWSGYKKITEENIANLPTFSGVYKLSTYNTSTEKCTPFYVGQAVNIHDRVVQHTGKSETNSCIKSRFEKYVIYVNYAAVASQLDRDAVEVALYNHYKPDCNDVDALPDVKPADVSSLN